MVRAILAGTTLAAGGDLICLRDAIMCPEPCLSLGVQID